MMHLPARRVTHSHNRFLPDPPETLHPIPPPPKKERNELQVPASQGLRDAVRDRRRRR